MRISRFPLTMCRCYAAKRAKVVPSDPRSRVEHMFVAKAHESAVGTQAQACGPTLRELERQIGELAAHLAAETCRWLVLIAEFDRRNGHEASGFTSCASWLAWRCGIAPRAAFEHVRVARCLVSLPQIRAAFGCGVLTYSKVRALTRVAEPAMEAELLELAREATAAQLERLMRGYRGALAEDATTRAFERRRVETQWDDDGSLRISGSLPAEEGELLLKALELARERLNAEINADAREHRDEPGAAPRATKADAIVVMAESTIARGVTAAAGGERHQLVVHVDVDQLAMADDGDSGASGGDRGGELPSGVRLPAEAVRRLGCDASIVALFERNGKPISVGRKTRSVPPSIARALRARDGGCRFPGCDRETFVDAHHVVHWALGGETSLGNLVQLCRHHHRLVHHGGFSVERHGDDLVFRRPGGSVIPLRPPSTRGDSKTVIRAQAREGALVSASTCRPRSRGARMDADLAVFALAHLHTRRTTKAAPDLARAP